MNDHDISLREIQSARKRGHIRANAEPRVDRVRFNARRRTLELDLRGGIGVSIPIDRVREFSRATNAELASIEPALSGEAIRLGALDVDISLPGLLRDLFGVSAAASLMGSRGGKATSEAKSVAAIANGKRGGRPRKIAQH